MQVVINMLQKFQDIVKAIQKCSLDLCLLANVYFYSSFSVQTLLFICYILAAVGAFMLLGTKVNTFYCYIHLP